MTLWSTNWQLSHKKLQDFDELQTGVIVQIPTCLLPYVNLSSSYDTSFKELRIDFVINNQHFSKYSQTKAAKKQKKKKTQFNTEPGYASITTRLNKVYKVCNTKKELLDKIELISIVVLATLKHVHSPVSTLFIPFKCVSVIQVSQVIPSVVQIVGSHTIKGFGSKRSIC